MVGPVLEALQLRPGDTVADLTVGGGGHSSQFLRQLGDGGRLLALDRDEDALAAADGRLGNDQRLVLKRASFDEFGDVITELGWSGIDKALMDLGVSSHQLDTAGRGFSFRGDGPLDMRMDRRQALTAADILADRSEKELADIFYLYGEERRSRAVARAVVQRRVKTPFETTSQLADMVAGVVGRRGRIHPATRVFQALRVAVNGELEQLRSGLEQVLEKLLSGGRMVVLTYHSLEDRMVKQFFSRASGRCICPREVPVCCCEPKQLVNRLTRKPVVASQDEIKINPRARSAKLRAVQKL